MNRILNYFLSFLVIAATLFFASCSEDTETPGGPLTVSLEGAENAAPGDTVEITVTVTNGTTGTEATILSNPTGSFVDSDNTATSGESVMFIVPTDAALGDTYTLTASVTSGGSQANDQLVITIAYGTVADVVVKNSDFSILAAALDATGLVDDLQGDGPFTVFAPTDAALEAMGITADNIADVPGLEDILMYHVIPTQILASGLTNETWIETLEGDSIWITNDGTTIMVDGATVSMADITADNGVVHGINQVLLPNNLSAYTAKLLYAPTGDMNSKTFFSSMDGMLYSYNDVTGTADPVSADIDFGYFYGATSGASLISPDEDLWSNPVPAGVGYDMSAWGTRNATEFKTSAMTAAEFDAIMVNQDFTVTSEFDEFGTSPDNPKRVTSLAAGDVIAFKTAGEMYGLIKVVSVAPGAGTTGYIEIEVKVTR